MDLSIIIVNYNTKFLTTRVIESVVNTTHNFLYEIIVVDNSDIKDEYYTNSSFSQVKIIPNVQNKGFGNACNIGARVSKGKYLLFLNSDTIVNENCIDNCLSYLNNNDNIGVLGAKTLLEDGSIDNNCRRGFPTPVSSLYYYLGLSKLFPKSKKFGAYKQTFLNDDSISEVDAVSGSFMIIPSSIFKNIGGFDEDYFMYGEDLDLCYRIKKSNYKIIYFPLASIIHIKGQSGLNKKSKKVVDCFYNSMIIFYDKHYKDKYNVFTNFLVKFAINSKRKLSK